jgi:co-chaperonin GroES (HSP10)
LPLHLEKEDRNVTEIEVKVGDYVLVSQNGGPEFAHDDGISLVFRQNDILAIFSELKLKEM